MTITRALMPVQRFTTFNFSPFGTEIDSRRRFAHIPKEYELKKVLPTGLHCTYGPEMKKYANTRIGEFIDIYV